MDTAGHAFGPAMDASRHASVLAGARSASDVVSAVRGYLAAWPKARVADLQRSDGGWAPFDADLQGICDAVHGQCASLQGAGVAPAPELLELEVFLLLACAKLAEIEPGLAPQRPSLAERQPASRALR